ncbi:MAG: carbohydrate binding family 9 domain-containing protein [Roseivirga sp.]|nr:carbohydrate binding family 9 domain-containing protein [Roseivirga sp.]
MLSFRIKLSFILVLLTFQVIAHQEQNTILKKNSTAIKITEAEIPLIDGKLNENIWKIDSANLWGGDFIQRTPAENTAPSQQTLFSILYDTKYIYVGIKCLDSSPEAINSRMSRRDGNDGDWVEVAFDTDHDLSSAFSFTVTAAGVKGDKVITQNGANEDASWNPVWYVKSAINQNGWTAEMKIPLTQLRFGKDEQQTWGLQLTRRFFRNEEKSVWQRIPLDAPGWVSEFGELRGLNGIKSQRQLEIQPFIVSSLKTFEKSPKNPFRNTNLTNTTIGLDGKVGITNNLALDFTINPDFGQVEADPAAIALDGFQLFFEEQRPFFVTNKEIFDYRFSSPVIGGSFSTDNLFYSRRIGRSPQGQVSTEPGEYLNMAERTTILGAAKFSGKTKNGLSLGIIESITATEYAEISKEGSISRVPIEPLTNYFVGRVQKDFNSRNSYIGGIFTSTNRNLTEELDFLHKSAVTVGIDFKHQWNNRSWYLAGSFVASQVKGSAEAIQNTQTSIRHLFQRIDASHVAVDPDKTSLAGHGGDLKFGKAGKGHVKFETGLTWRSPSLELNDIGFLREADDIQNYLGITYQSLKPFGIFRDASIGYKHWLVWDFEGNHNYFDWDIELNGTFKNNWTGTFGYFSQPHIYSKSLLRGGPRLFLPDQSGLWWALGTDGRKKLSASLNGWTKTGNESAYYLLENGIQITWQPINQFSISVNPTYTTISNRLQYNTQLNFNNQKRYITSILDQETLSLAIRLNYSVNSNLSIQYYGQPYISVGRYSDFNFVSNPLATNQQKQLSFYTPDQLSITEESSTYSVDENGDSFEDYSFANPDFSFAQFRSNLVLRYEYKPGSEIFLVWSQGITNTAMANGSLRDNFREQIFNKRPENTFLIKITYRFFK